MFIKTILSRYVIGCLLLVLSLVHHQSARADIEFFSISEMTAIMYDAPSLKAEKLYVASRYLPVEVVVPTRLSGEPKPSRQRTVGLPITSQMKQT